MFSFSFICKEKYFSEFIRGEMHFMRQAAGYTLLHLRRRKQKILYITVD